MYRKTRKNRVFSRFFAKSAKNGQKRPFFAVFGPFFRVFSRFFCIFLKFKNSLLKGKGDFAILRKGSGKRHIFTHLFE